MADDTLLSDMYERLRTLADSGDEAAAQKYIEENFTKLPEDVQGELLTNLYSNAVKDHVIQADTLADVQEAGLKALDELEAMKKKIEEEGSGPQPAQQ